MQDPKNNFGTVIVLCQGTCRAAEFCSVADPHHDDADPDPAFHFYADLDPTFQFDADPDPPNTHFFPDLDRPMLQKV